MPRGAWGSPWSVSRSSTVFRFQFSVLRETYLRMPPKQGRHTGRPLQMLIFKDKRKTENGELYYYLRVPLKQSGHIVLPL
jgi:hypothetical protein